MDKFACKHCGTLLCKNSRKIKDHMIKVCKKCPTYVKKTLEEENNKLSYNKTQKTQNTIEIFPNENYEEQEIEIISSSSGSITSNSESEPIFENIRREGNLRNFFDVLPQEENENLKKFFARFIYANRLPFRIVENERILKFFKAMRPLFKVPSRHDLSKPLLDAEYDEVKKSTFEALTSSDCLTIVIDG
jgi:hypothetical protein